MAWGKEWAEQSVAPLETLAINNIAQYQKQEKVYNNLPPTHDPYTNPDTHIYYQCNCGAILDPGTKSFAALNNAAMNAGWKVRWGAISYQPYCVECGKDIE